MPIKILDQSVLFKKNKLNFEPNDRQFQIEFCGDNCLLRDIEGYQIVRNGQTIVSFLALKAGNTLLLPIGRNERSWIHPLGANEKQVKPDVYQRLLNHSHNNVMHIEAKCHCMLKTNIINGTPLIDVATMPPWQKLQIKKKPIIIPNEPLKKISFDFWKKWMEELAKGLAFLHKQNISHGDPYPFNAIIEEEMNQAIWVDLGNIGDDNESICMDVWAFLFYTVFYTLKYSDSWSISLVEDTFRVISENTNTSLVCEELSNVFKQRRDDSVQQKDYSEVVLKVLECLNKYKIINQSELGLAGQKFLILGDLNYYSDFMYWLKETDDIKNQLELERFNMKLINLETNRLMVPIGKFQKLNSEFSYSKKELDNKLELISQLENEMKNKDLKINELSSEFQNFKQQLNGALDDSNLTLKNTKVLLEESKDLLVALNGLKSYKTAKFLRILKEEYKSNSLKGLSNLAKLITKYAVGKRGILEKYNKNDLLNKTLINISDSIESINTSTGFGDSILSAAKEVKEIKRITYKNNNYKKRVAYFTNQLLDWFDCRPRFGGGERYCISLADLMREHGLEVDIYQIAPKEFEGEYYGYKVKAIKHGDFYSEFNIDGANEFYNISLGYDYVLYNMPELSAGRMRPDAISICHGIWFDHNNYGPMYHFREEEWFKYLYKAFSNPQKYVSVDTNSINVIRALWPNLANKMRFIPNFVDHNQFYPSNEIVKKEKLTILFPRRSQINRGSRILETILKNIPYDVDIFWVGEGDSYDTQLIIELTKNDKRLKFEKDAAFEKMPEWYRKADIVVIPTIACEGTSLSCIESLASGCATIATNVGGLSDIIQDGVNGRLVDPDPIAIARAINKLIEDTSEREKYRKNGYESSFAFSIERWKKKWVEILLDEGWLENQDQKCKESSNNQRMAIVTRNGYHGGVESLIKIESEKLNAQVFVAGGINNPENTCPFSYTYVETYEDLLNKLKDFDVILYHWPMDWAVKAIDDSGIPSVEFVHRVDTAECDKDVPTIIATHSEYVKKYLEDTQSKRVEIVPNVVDTERFTPTNVNKKKVIGAITSYYMTKGIDIFIEAWSILKEKYPDYFVKLYGSGEDENVLRSKADELGVNIDFNPATNIPENTYNELMLYVTASRIEGLPIAVLEALSCNVPVIASDIQGHKVINEICEGQGVNPPIILFKNENSEDLAEKIDIFLRNYEKEIVNVRDSIIKVFSHEKHVDGIKKLLNNAISMHKNKKGKTLELIDEHINNGVFAKSETDEGFYYIVSENENVIEKVYVDKKKLDIDFVTEHSKFLAYKYKLPQEVRTVSVKIDCYSNYPSNIFLQFNHLGENGEVLKSNGNGRYVNPNSETSIYSIDELNNNTNNKFIEIIIRPNQFESSIVRKIHIKSWK